MVDLVQVTLVVIAFFSLLFVVLTEGFKHTFGYRGSEETRTRKDRIDTALHRQVIEAINAYVLSDKCKKDDEKTKMERFQDLGYKAFIAESLTTDILNRSNYLMERAFKILLVTIAVLFATIYAGINLDLTILINLIIFIIYVSVAAYYFWLPISALRKCYALRNEFVLFDENPTLEYADDLFNELIERKLLYNT
jgi:ABC-type multidrug transport system fused ATPase/permease subunit